MIWLTSPIGAVRERLPERQEREQHADGEALSVEHQAGGHVDDEHGLQAR